MTIHKFGWMIYNLFMNNSLRWDLDGTVIIIYLWKDLRLVYSIQMTYIKASTIQITRRGAITNDIPSLGVYLVS